MKRKTKKCIICGKRKPMSSFHKVTQNTDGHNNKCKKCRSEEHKPYYKKNRKKIINKTIKWCKDNPDRCNANGRRSYWRHRDTQILRKAAYRKKNHKKIRAYNKKYYRKNKSTIRHKTTIWWHKHPEKAHQHNRTRRALKAGVKEKFTSEMKDITFQIFGNRCFKCGSKHVLVVDHFLPLSKKNALTLLNAILLCNKCNSTKWNRDPEDFFTPLQIKRAQRLMLHAQELYTKQLRLKKAA